MSLGHPHDLILDRASVGIDEYADDRWRGRHWQAFSNSTALRGQMDEDGGTQAKEVDAETTEAEPTAAG